MSENENNGNPQEHETILGLTTNDLAGLGVDKLVDNPTAITMLLYYYKQLTDENRNLKNELNTYSTYVNGYEKKLQSGKIAAILFTLSNLGIGFGIALIQSGQVVVGLFSLLPALGMIGAGIYFTIIEK